MPVIRLLATDTTASFQRRLHSRHATPPPPPPPPPRAAACAFSRRAMPHEPAWLLRIRTVFAAAVSRRRHASPKFFAPFHFRRRRQSRFSSIFHFVLRLLRFLMPDAAMPPITGITISLSSGLALLAAPDFFDKIGLRAEIGQSRHNISATVGLVDIFIFRYHRFDARFRQAISIRQPSPVTPIRFLDFPDG